MRLRVSRWFWWTLAFGSTPLVAAFVVSFVETGHAPSRIDLLGNGQGMLTAVAWLGAAIRELRDAPLERAAAKENLTGSAFVMAILTAIAYGAVATRLGSGPLDASVSSSVSWISLVLLAAAALLSLCAVAVATPTPDAEVQG